MIINLLLNYSHWDTVKFFLWQSQIFIKTIILSIENIYILLFQLFNCFNSTVDNTYQNKVFFYQLKLLIDMVNANKGIIILDNQLIFSNQLNIYQNNINNILKENKSNKNFNYLINNNHLKVILINQENIQYKNNTYSVVLNKNYDILKFYNNNNIFYSAENYDNLWCWFNDLINKNYIPYQSLNIIQKVIDNETPAIINNFNNQVYQFSSFYYDDCIMLEIEEITASMEIQNQLHNNYQLIKHLLSSFTDPTIIFNKQQKIQCYNESLQNLLGLDFLNLYDNIIDIQDCLQHNYEKINNKLIINNGHYNLKIQIIGDLILWHFKVIPYESSTVQNNSQDNTIDNIIDHIQSTMKQNEDYQKILWISTDYNILEKNTIINQKKILLCKNNINNQFINDEDLFFYLKNLYKHNTTIHFCNKLKTTMIINSNFKNILECLLEDLLIWSQYIHINFQWINDQIFITFKIEMINYYLQNYYINILEDLKIYPMVCNQYNSSFIIHNQRQQLLINMIIKNHYSNNDCLMTNIAPQ